MSAAEVELTRKLFALLAEGGVDATADSFHPDFEFTTPAHLASEPGTYRGVEGARRWFDTFYEAMDRVEIVPVEIVDAGKERVALSMRLESRGRSTGLEVSQDGAMLVHFADGKILLFEIVASLDEALALAAAGQEEGS